MECRSKVVWSEGMLLRQQHFQQQEKYLIERIKQSSVKVLPDNYGFTLIELDQQLLPLKRFSLMSAEGIFPDGTPFVLGNQAAAAIEPLTITEGVLDITIYLCLPLESQILPRYKSEVYQIQDENDTSPAKADIVMGKLNLQFKTSEDDLSQFTLLPVAKVKYCNGKEGVVLEDKFIAPALELSAIVELKRNIEELAGLLGQRIKILADRVATPSKLYVADLKEWLLLQTLNRHHLIWKQAVTRLQQHPIYFYNLAIQLIGELATFTQEKKYCDMEINYKQHNLYETFFPIFQMLRQQLNQAIEQNAFAVTLEKTPQGWWQSIVLSSEVFDTCQLVIAAKADLPYEELQERFLTQVKVCSADQIFALLHSQLPGLPLEVMLTIPPTIPYHAGYLYFTVADQSELWQDIKKFGQLAIHATSQIPQLDLNCWMIKR